MALHRRYPSLIRSAGPGTLRQGGRQDPPGRSLDRTTRWDKRTVRRKKNRGKKWGKSGTWDFLVYIDVIFSDLNRIFVYGKSGSNDLEMNIIGEEIE